MHYSADQFCPIDQGDTLASPRFAAFYKRWDDARGDADMPHMSCIRPAEIPPDFLPHVTIIGVENGGTRFVIRLAGSGIQEIAHVEMTGWQVDEKTSDPVELEMSRASLNRMKWGVQNHKPYCLGARALWSGNDMLAQRTLVLPYAGDDGTVQRFLTLNDLEITEDPCHSCTRKNCAVGLASQTQPAIQSTRPQPLQGARW